MERITIPEVGEIHMDNLSKFIGLLVEFVDLKRDIDKRFYNAKAIMSEGLDATNTMREHAYLIDVSQSLYEGVAAEIYKKAFDEVIMLADSIHR